MFRLSKRWSTSSTKQARVAAAKSYLDAWVGNNAKAENVRMSSNPLLVSGTSYLLATLRLEKTDTPESVAQRLQDHPSNTASNQWKCPIVLDLRAWAPDGSPHYRPPPTGTLKSLVGLLNRHGLAVMGVNGTPKELEKEAFQQLGLPALWSSNRPTSLKYELEDILQMIVKRQQELPTPDDEPQVQEEIMEATLVEEKKQKDVLTARKEELLRADGPGGITQNSSEHGDSSEKAASQLPPISPSATIYQGYVRSGQQVSSKKGCSLVILGSVSSGGEVLSDGDILVMGKLRGRALAGLSSPSASIISTCMDPELVSVSGVLSTGDQLGGLVSGSPGMASLNDQKEIIFQKI